jgi:hypothetical protein
LLTIDEIRLGVGDRIVRGWGRLRAQSSAGMAPKQLREMLAALRDDEVLAASLAGSLEGLRDILARSMAGGSVVATGRVRDNALGDRNADVHHTPIPA